MPVNRTGSRYSPRTVKEPWLPRLVVTVNSSPVRRPDDFARLVSMSAPSVPRSANSAFEPSSCQSKSKTSWAVAGSIVLRNWLPPGSVRTSGKRRSCDHGHPRHVADHVAAGRGEGVEVVGLQDQVALDHAVDRAGERLLQPGGEDGHEGDEPDADHQRGGRRRGASGVARGVGAREAAGGAGAASIGAPMTAASGRTMKRASIPTPMKTRIAPRASTWRASVAPRSAGQAVDEEQDAAHQEHAGEVGRDAAEAPRRQGGPLLHGRDRRHPGGSQRGPHGRDDGHHDAHQERDDHRARLDLDARPRAARSRWRRRARGCRRRSRCPRRGR